METMRRTDTIPIRYHPVFWCLIILVLSLMMGPNSGGAMEGSGTMIPTEGDKKSGGEVSGTGTIRYISLEGGFYGIISDDGKKYLPVHLDQEFKTDGLRVAFRLRIRTDVMTIYMWGTPVEVISLKKVE